MSDTVCSQCGATQVPGAECEACFHVLLAFENEHPPAFGAVHHLTVATYYLQHPRGYTAEVLEAWRNLLHDALDGRAGIAELRRRHGRRFAGTKRVKDGGAAHPPNWPTTWSMHVANVLNPLEPLPSEDEYIRRALAWASAARDDLSKL